MASTTCGDENPPDVTPPAPPITEAGPPLDANTPVQDNGSCVPWSTVRGQTFASASDASQSVMATLDVTAKQMVGSWIGHAVSPWGEWDLTIAFTADGHYVARAYNGTVGAQTVGGGTIDGATIDGGTTGGWTPPPFYYGADTGCDALKQWRLTGVTASGSVTGQLDVPFSYGSTSCALPAWMGELSNLAFDASANRLNFDFSTSDGNGPITYDLWRVC